MAQLAAATRGALPVLLLRRQGLTGLLALVLFGVVAFLPTARAQTFSSTQDEPSCGVAFKLKAARRGKLLPGRSTMVMARVSNGLPQDIEGLTVALNVPDFLVPIRGKARPRTADQPAIDGRSVYITNLTIPRRKSVAIWIRVRVPLCQPAGLASLEAVAFILDQENVGELTCLTAAPPLQLRTYVASKHAAPALNAPFSASECAVPTPAPSVPAVELIAENKRCLEAQPVEIPGRRRQHQRQLQLDPFDALCNSACGSSLSFVVPYYFGVFTNNYGERTCYCCPTCSLIPDPNFVQFKANEPPFTQSPTAGPTVRQRQRWEKLKVVLM